MVIANPAASQFTGGAHREVMAVLDRMGRVESSWPGSAGEAEARSRRAAEEGADLVVAMGGDGMTHHVAQGVVGTATALGIIPVGTTNVFARLMGIPSRPARAARLLTEGREPTAVGVARLTLHRGTTTTVHHSLFACGFGLDAAIVAAADRDPYRKYRFGSIHYARTALGVVLGRYAKVGPHLTVVGGGKTNRASALVLQFREVYTYFGRRSLHLTPRRPDPMTALLVERLRRRRIPGAALALLRRRDLGEVPGLAAWEGVDSLSVEADPPVAAQADGESLGMVDRAEVEWLPGALGVVSRQSPR